MHGQALMVFSATTEDIAGLEAGVYSLVITDDNGSTNYSYTLTDPSASAIALTTVITPVICSIPNSYFWSYFTYANRRRW